MDKIEQLAQKSSRKQIPALFKKIPWVKGQRNLDWGGGKYDDATNWLRDEHGVENMVVDKFNRSEEHNQSIIDDILVHMYNGDPYIHTATLANVLNVIPNKSDRLTVLKELALNIALTSTTVYISCYEATGQPKVSECQTRMKLKDYLPEIKEIFRGEVTIKAGVITVHPEK